MREFTITVTPSGTDSARVYQVQADTATEAVEDLAGQLREAEDERVLRRHGIRNSRGVQIGDGNKQNNVFN